MPWWERWPDRLKYELAELARVEVKYELDDAALQAGIVQLVVYPQVGDERHRLVAVYPDFYPDVRFEVFADDLTLDHHQNPFSKNLCLIGRATDNWHTTDTLAEFLRVQLPKVLMTGRSDDLALVKGEEEHQAEPYSAHYMHSQPDILLVDSSWKLDSSILGGELRIGLEKSTAPVRGAILEIRSPEGAILARADDAIRQRYSRHKPVIARWIRSPKEIRHLAGKDFLNAIADIYSRLRDPKWQRVENGFIDVVGVIFPEEVQWRESGVGWVFLLRSQDSGGSRGSTKYHLVKAGYAGRGDLAARVPELRPLSQTKIAVIGLGALGMPSALAFARSGVAEIRALDIDIVDPGIAPRWPLGLTAAGHSKVAALKDFVDAEYPYTAVRPFQHRIGAVRRFGTTNGGTADTEVLSDLLDGVDLVYDATAEAGLHPLLDRLCRERSVPYICVSSTNGAWGGTLVRTRVGTGCWHCFLSSQEDGTITIPTEAPNDWVQPVGCASPTFTGAGFDLEQIALTGVRLAVGTLAGPTAGGYLDLEWDVGIAYLRDDAGRPIPPNWQISSLSPRPGCPACGAP